MKISKLIPKETYKILKEKYPLPVPDKKALNKVKVDFISKVEKEITEELIKLWE